MPKASLSIRRFELVEGSSSKFWEVSTDGAQLTVRFGRMGTEGTVKEKSFPTADDAARELAKLVAEKAKKGYLEKGAVGETAAAAPAKKAAAKAAKTPEPGVENAVAGPIERMLGALRKKHKSVHDDLHPGASQTDVDKLRGLGVPPLFVALYAAHDGVEGEDFLAEFGLLPIAHILSEQKMMSELLAEKPDWKEREWWNARWVPFLSDRGGQLYCFDPVGALEGGKPGQIVFFDHEQGPRIELQSFDVFVDLVTALARKGALLDRDDERFSEIYGDAQAVGAERMPSKELKGILKRVSDHDSRGEPAAILELVLPLAKRYSADQELWRAVAGAAESLERWDVAAEAAGSVVRLESPSQRYSTVSSLVFALHKLGRDDKALAELAKVLKSARNESECTLAIPGHNQRSEYASNPDTAPFQRKCLALWTEHQPKHIEAWWNRASYAIDAGERKTSLENTVELCTDARAKFNSWVLDRRKKALALLAELR